MTPARRRFAAAPLVVGAAALCVLVAVAMIILRSGWSTFVITSPSMGTTAPVGSLVVVHAESTYRVGQIVSFRVDGRTITHRIVTATASGFTTKGDLNASPDGWKVPPGDIIGAAAWVAPGLGWLLRGLPWLALGAVLAEVIGSFLHLRRDGRWVTRLSAWSIAVTAVDLWLRPWFDVELLDFRPASDQEGGGALMHVVNTGLLPLTAKSTRFGSGQDVVVRTTEHTAGGLYTLSPTPSLTVWEFGIVAAICLTPLLVAIVVGRRASGDTADVAVAATARRVTLRRRVGVSLIAALTVVGVLLMLTMSTGAAFAAAIRNSTDVAGTNAAFTCQEAETKLGSSAYAIYRLGTSGVTSEPDLSGNSRTGTYATSTTTSSSYGCVRDSPLASVTFNGTSQCEYVPGRLSSPTTFTLEAWFRTSTASNGRIIGFGSNGSGSTDTDSDRLVYIAPSGRIFFGVYPSSTTVTIATPAGTSYADGKWHQVVASLSSAGMALYVDGSLASTNTSVTSGQVLSGYWKIGCGTLLYWAVTPGSGDTSYMGPAYFTGQIQYVAIYTSALTAAQVKSHYLAGTAN